MGEKLKWPLDLVSGPLAVGFHPWSRVCPAVPRGVGHSAAAEPAGSCQASPWHTGAQRVPPAESHSSPRPVPSSVAWQPSQPRGCHLAKQVLETPAEKIATIRLWIETSLTNKGTPGPWVPGQGRASNPANLGKEDGQDRRGRACPRSSGSTCLQIPYFCGYLFSHL